MGGVHVDQYYTQLLQSRPRKEWEMLFRRAHIGYRVFIASFLVAFGVPIIDLYLKAQQADLRNSNEMVETSLLVFTYCIIFTSTMYMAWSQVGVLPWIKTSKAVHWVVAVLFSLLGVTGILLVLMQAFHENQSRSRFRAAVAELEQRSTHDEAMAKTQDETAYLSEYYKALQAALDAKGSKMAATDFNVDEIRHAWAYMVSPSAFLSMAVRPKLDDLACRRAFPERKYLLSPDGLSFGSDVPAVDSPPQVGEVIAPSGVDAESKPATLGLMVSSGQEVSSKSNSVDVEDVATRLRRLDALFEQGLITSEERARQRTAILETI